MKALSLREPYATLIRNGEKTLETRKWTTSYRGDLLICASKNVDRAAMWRLRSLIDYEDIKPGKAVCIVTLDDCRPMTAHDEKDACCPLYDRANAWILTELRQIVPFPVKGHLGLFEVPFEVR